MDLEHNSCHITHCREDAENFVVFYFGEFTAGFEFEDNELSMVVGFCPKHYENISESPLNQYIRYDRLLEIKEEDF